MISIVTPTFNEKQNIKKLCLEIKEIFTRINLEYEQIIIDNNSTDGTIDIIKKIALEDKKIKVIINQKNFGHIRSPYYGLLQTSGDASILISSDFQDPPELIEKFIDKWKEGNKVVLAQKTSSDEGYIIKNIRKIYYKFLKKISSTQLTINTTGAGLFDKEVIKSLKNTEDPYPYLRGLVMSFGYKFTLVQFEQPIRKFGKTKNNLFSLIDIGMLGIIKHSILPIRLMTILGFASSILFFGISVAYLMLKIFFWNSFQSNIAPLLIGIFLIGSIIIFMLGLIGEYIKVIMDYSKKGPIIIEKERINF
jgi:polyisoprenyl-phosphate glycosyltransferase